MATVNENGEKYSFVAIADDSFGYGMLHETTVLKIDEIGKFIETALKDTRTSAETRKEVILMESCLFKLQAVLYHLHNIKKFKENLLIGIKRDLENKNVSVFTSGYLPRELVFEFEALLLQARACLDALTVLVIKRLQPGQQTNYFTKLKKVLESSKMNEHIEKIIGLLNESNWLFESGVLYMTT